MTEPTYRPLSDILEDHLREILRDPGFQEKWVQMRWADHLNDEDLWESKAVTARRIALECKLWDTTRFVWSNDVWKRIMLEEGMMS